MKSLVKVNHPVPCYKATITVCQVFMIVTVGQDL